MKKNRKNCTELGEAIYEARKKMGLTQMQFAEKCGFCFSQVQRIENGKSINPQISTLSKLSRGFPDIFKMEELLRLTGYLEEGEAVTLAQRVKDARLVKGWSQAELAKKCGVVPSSIAMIELGQVKRPHPKLRMELKQQLRIDI